MTAFVYAGNALLCDIIIIYSLAHRLSFPYMFSNNVFVFFCFFFVFFVVVERHYWHHINVSVAYQCVFERVCYYAVLL